MEQSHQESQRLDAVLRALDEGLILTNGQGLIIDINPSAERLTAWRRSEALGRPYNDILRITAIGDERHRLPLTRAGDAAALPASSDWMLLTRDNRRLLVRVRVTSAPAEPAPEFIAIAFSDVTEETLLVQDHSFRSTHDALTGLLNRDEFVRRVRQACAVAPKRGREHIIAIVDVDRFGAANEAFGHAAGDKLLRELSAELRGRLRSSDLLARVGGDEFGLLLLDCKPQEGALLLDALLQATRNYRFYWGGKSLGVTVSIGATRMTTSAQHEARLLSLVAAACFAAKDAGRDCVLFIEPDRALTDRTDDLGIAAHLSAALDEERFVLCYQDAVRIDDPGKPVYRELLLRLRHDQDELVLPHRFIPAAEHYFLMNSIDRWVAHTALRHIAAGTDGAADGLTYAINVSGQSISDAGFLQFIIKCLESSAADPRRICFEISENVAVTGLSEAAHFMRRLGELGCRFAIDHFGSGMASFSYLSNLPVHYIKIEGSLVRAMLSSSMNRSLVEGIYRVGRDIGVTTIAEHVETLELLEPLRAIGVDLAQGMAISPIQILARP